MDNNLPSIITSSNTKQQWEHGNEIPADHGNEDMVCVEDSDEDEAHHEGDFEDPFVTSDEKVDNLDGTLKVENQESPQSTPMPTSSFIRKREFTSYAATTEQQVQQRASSIKEKPKATSIVPPFKTNEHNEYHYQPNPVESTPSPNLESYSAKEKTETSFKKKLTKGKRKYFLIGSITFAIGLAIGLILVFALKKSPKHPATTVSPTTSGFITETTPVPTTEITTKQSVTFTSTLPSNLTTIGSNGTTISERTTNTTVSHKPEGNVTSVTISNSTHTTLAPTTLPNVTKNHVD